MRLTARLAPAIAASTLVLDPALLPARQAAALPDLLGAAAAYVARYEAQASGIVFEEEYVQQLRGRPGSLPVARRMRSEVVVLNTADLGWIGFRNVLQVNGKPVSDRVNRLEKLFAAPVTSAAIGRARLVADESARYNLGSVFRNWTYPTMPLMFLRQSHQRRSTFALDGSERVDGVLSWRVRFEETQRPTLIGSDRRDVLTSGRFWIEPGTGRVLRSQLAVREPRATGTIDVAYDSVPGLTVLVPRTMDERIELFQEEVNPRVMQTRTLQEEIRGEARYSNFKQFTVEVETTVHVESTKP